MLFSSSTILLAMMLLQSKPSNAQDIHNAQWMSGNHGIGFRIPGGVDFESCLYNTANLVNQIQTNIPEITYVIVGLSSGAFGDRYLSPHSVLSDISRASTPKQTENVPGKPSWFTLMGGGAVIDFDLENYPDRDLFRELLIDLHAAGLKVIAYMAGQGPALLKQGERVAYDYHNKSPFVDSTAECAILTNNTITDGKCSPSVRKWNNYVKENYGSDDSTTLKKAYAEVIVDEYAKKFNGKDGNPLIDGWWFDQGTYMDYGLVHDLIIAQNPNASIAFNRGPKSPLQNNSPGYEKYTAGHPFPINKTPPYDLKNLPIIESAEASDEGYFKSGDEYSLAHVYQMTNDNWNNGDLVWDETQEREDQAIDWMSRVLAAKGAWTWNVKRQFYPPLLHPDDVTFLKDVYASLKPTEKPSMNPSDSPSLQPTFEPSSNPSAIPSLKASLKPSSDPTLEPSLERSSIPSVIPSSEPSRKRSSGPSSQPSLEPTLERSSIPSVVSSSKPSLKPSSGPSSQPSLEPTLEPSSIPSVMSSSKPSLKPSSGPSSQPSLEPTLEPSSIPSVMSSSKPSSGPSSQPSIEPTSNPSVMPSTCEEEPSSKFVLKLVLNNDDTVKKVKKSTCERLSGKSTSLIKRICRRSVAHDGVGSAKASCPFTCSICTAPCEDSSSDKFVEKLVVKDGEVRKFKTNVCSSLKFKKPSVVARICKRSKTHDGVGSAKEVCPVSCKECP